MNLKIKQVFGYFIAILLTFSASWYFISKDKSNLVSASEKSVASVVSISSAKNGYSGKNDIGSGVIFSEDGYIVTNLHILSGSEISVGLSNGDIYPASIIGIDKNTDIAVLKIKPNTKLKSIKIADSDNLKVGDRVLAIGNPYGIGISVSSGIISATGRDYGNPYLQLIQTDAAINPGNSGGALINENGYLIGINSKIFSRTGAYQGIGFAIPSNQVVQISTQLIRYGQVKTLWIGNFRVAKIRVKYNAKILNALKIVEIDPIGPLYEKGVKTNDVILFINSESSNWNNLISSLRFATLGQDLRLDLINENNQLFSVEFKKDK